MNYRTKLFLEAPVLPLLIKLAAPNTLAFIIQSAVMLTDVWIVSRLGTGPLAAVALAFPVLMITLTLPGGALGGAVTSSISRSLGAGKLERAEKLLWHAILISIGGAITLLTAFLLGGSYLLKLLGGTGQILADAKAYSLVILWGGLSLWFAGSLAAALRATGNMRFPAMVMILSSISQICLSGGFVLGWFGLPVLGIVGAAVSVIISQTGLSLLLLFKLTRPSEHMRLRLSRISFEKELFADIFAVALPASLSPLLTVSTILVMTGLVGQFGPSALAGFGIGSRIEFLMVPLVFGVGAAMTAMVGTNVGAGNIMRAEQIGWYGGTFSACLSGVIGISLALTPSYWVPFFTSDQATYVATTKYIQIVGPFYAFQGLGISLYFASQGANAVKWPIIATIIRFVLAASAGSIAVYGYAAGLESVFYSIAFAMLCFGTITVTSLKLGTWRKAK